MGGAGYLSKGGSFGPKPTSVGSGGSFWRGKGGERKSEEKVPLIVKQGQRQLNKYLVKQGLKILRWKSSVNFGGFGKEKGEA